MSLDRLSLDLLARALDQTGELVSGIERNQAGLPTPCSEFDVRALVNHTVYDLRSRIAQAKTSDAVQYRPTADSVVVAAERSSDWGTSGTRLIDRGRLLDALDRAVARKVT